METVAIPLDELTQYLSKQGRQETRPELEQIQQLQRALHDMIYNWILLKTGK